MDTAHPHPAETIRHYLTHNIHYTLTPDCIRTIELFRHYAAEIDALPPLQRSAFYRLPHHSRYLPPRLPSFC